AVIAVDEVEVVSVLEDRVVRADAVPAHVRDLEASALGVDHVLAEAHDAPAEDREAGRPRRLVALLEEDLHAEADAEVGAAAVDVLEHDLAEPAAERHRAPLDGPLAGHHEAIGAADLVGIAGDVGPRARALERARDAVEVPHAEIEDGDL